MSGRNKDVPLDARLEGWLASRRDAAHVSEVGAQFDEYGWPSVRNALWRLKKDDRASNPRPRYWQFKKGKTL